MKIFELSDLWYFAVGAVVCYLIGCFNFAVLIAGFKKLNIRQVGSGNPGTMNMTRSLGLKFGAVNFFCDVLKGGLPVLAAYFLFKDYVFENSSVVVSDFARYFFGLFVIIGHIFPVTLKFKGGKGIASTMGAFLFALPCEEWWFIFIAVAFLICVLFYIIITTWGSMGSLIGVTVLSVFQAGLFVERYASNLKDGWIIGTFAILLVINVLTWFAHRKNIVRLLAGEEHRTVVRKRQ